MNRYCIFICLDVIAHDRFLNRKEKITGCIAAKGELSNFRPEAKLCYKALTRNFFSFLMFQFCYFDCAIFFSILFSFLAPIFEAPKDFLNSPLGTPVPNSNSTKFLNYLLKNLNSCITNDDIYTLKPTPISHAHSVKIPTFII